MTSFIGDILCKIEGSGRLLFPANFKKQIDGNQAHFVIKKDIYEKCLVLYTADEWERQLNIIRSKLNLYNKEHSMFLREFYKNTAEVELDSNGRMLIPKRLLEQIEVSKEVYMLGIDTKIEIWSKETYEGIHTSDEEFADLAQKILGNIDIND